MRFLKSSCCVSKITFRHGKRSSAGSSPSSSSSPGAEKGSLAAATQSQTTLRQKISDHEIEVCFAIFFFFFPFSFWFSSGNKHWACVGVMIDIYKEASLHSFKRSLRKFSALRDCLRSTCKDSAG